jgi:hypothetical protein
MERSEALAYIATFIQNSSINSIDASKHEMRRFFEAKLGKSLFSSTDKKIIELARHLYKAHVVRAYTRYRAFDLARKLDSSELEALLKAQVALDKKFGVYYDTIDRDLSDKAVDRAIRKQGLTNYKAILKTMDESQSPTKIKSLAAIERSKAKEAKLKAAGGKARKTSPEKKRSTKKRSPEKKTKARETRRVCSEYTVPELKEKAKEKGLSGYSKLKKDELCKLLKIK